MNVIKTLLKPCRTQSTAPSVAWLIYTVLSSKMPFSIIVKTSTFTSRFMCLFAVKSDFYEV